jgi:hypothetical protein
MYQKILSGLMFWVLTASTATGTPIWQPQIQIMFRPDFRKIVPAVIWQIPFNGPARALIIHFSRLSLDIPYQNALIVIPPEITGMQNLIVIHVTNRIISVLQIRIIVPRNFQQTARIATRSLRAGSRQLSITALFH